MFWVRELKLAVIRAESRKEEKETDKEIFPEQNLQTWPVHPTVVGTKKRCGSDEWATFWSGDRGQKQANASNAGALVVNNLKSHPEGPGTEIWEPATYR